ncbi:MAG: ABC transporter transmembrane domain-containing protein, partial [Brevundimonas sp.]
MSTYAQFRFTLLAEFNVGRRLLEHYLRQPYVWFLGRHSADIGKTILSEVTNVIHGGLIPLITVIAQTAVALALIVLLFLTDPILSLTICGALGFAYVIVYGVMKGVLSRLGQERLAANQIRFTAINETFTGIKEVKAGGLEDYYVRRFSRPAELYARHNATANIVQQLPRYLMEAVSFGGLMLIILFLMARDGQFIAALPTIALYALAGYRLMPALQQVYAGLAQLRFVEPALDTLHADLRSSRPDLPEAISSSNAVVELGKNIKLRGIEFAYPDT